MQFKFPTKIDRYIIKKFLGTFFFALALIITIAVVFDFSEKIDDFIEKEAPAKAIIFDYYLNFIPFFANLFSPLFVFIAVIFFTSKMANDVEIIAILNAGVSFYRILVPYLVSALIIALISFYFNGWIIPKANEKRIDFIHTYVKNPYVSKDRNIHRQIEKDNFVYMQSFSVQKNTGYQFAYEKFENNDLVYKLIADRIVWDSTANYWVAENYFIRELNGLEESITEGHKKILNIKFHPKELSFRVRETLAMNNKELNQFIISEKERGAGNIEFYEIEYHRRFSFPFATFILTLIGVSIASRKVRGGIGLQIGFGLVLSFSYIMFMQVSSTFATNGSLSPFLAVWIPNIVYAIIAIYLLKRASK
ncbi:MAG: YjgP/YjgQ family permease [Bacteroidia bacterium]|nr:LptF/LptG family permease [Bacteroidia bacterium]NNC85753.1 YjgP/YjgQ family permease [Bacteroidia bacterium]NNM16187.1 YjgP/YjgQ family permease [Bacteroidia bacterium]